MTDTPGPICRKPLSVRVLGWEYPEDQIHLTPREIGGLLERRIRSSLDRALLTGANDALLGLT